MIALGTIKIDNEVCKACGLCVFVCPKKVIKLDTETLNKRGFHPAKLYKDGCIACASCAVICPEAAITVYKEKKPKEKSSD